MTEIVLREDVFESNGLEKMFNTLDVSESTRREYAHFAKSFLHFVQERGLSLNSFLEYKRYLSGRTDFSVSTKNKYLTSARIMLKEMNRSGLIPIDVTHNVKSFKQGKKHKKLGLNEKEVSLVVSHLGRLPNTKQSLRLKALVSLLVLQGLRQCEIVRLDVADVDIANRLLFVRGKGEDDTEPVHLHPLTSSTLSEYMRQSKIADGALFVSWSNNGRNKRITTHTLRNIVKDTLSHLSINKTVHGFRHYFTTTLIKEYGGDLLQVARYTRHKSLEMLQVYDDSIQAKADLGRYYKAFCELEFK